MTARSLFLAILLGGCGMSTDGTSTPDAPGGVTATFTSLYGDYFGHCGQCHAPGAPGFIQGTTEATLNFSTKAMAYATIKNGMASGLTGNFVDCNGVPFLGAAPASSLIVAVLDQPTRQAFDLPAHPNCSGDAISDETVPGKVGLDPTAQFISSLKSWITAGAPNN
jgi:hypothetical protein